MHRVPENFDYDVFVGAALESVSFGAYIVHLDFSSAKSSPLHISVEGRTSTLAPRQRAGKTKRACRSGARG